VVSLCAPLNKSVAGKGHLYFPIVSFHNFHCVLAKFSFFLLEVFGSCVKMPSIHSHLVEIAVLFIFKMASE
jgi:hypothetical protein